MSFDLYFHRQQNSSLSEKAVAIYLDEHLPYCNREEGSKQWWYENPHTGVYFVIESNDPDETSDPDDLHYSFSINFLRPHFFGMEAFPIIEKTIADLHLLVLNPQDETDPDTPRQFDQGYFYEQWKRHNDGVSLDHFGEYDFWYLPVEKSNALWWYQLHRQEIEDNLPTDTFVPQITVIKREEDNTLFTVVVWPTHIPLILPPVDYVVIKKKIRKLFKTVEETGVVRFDAIIHQLGHFFDPFDHSVPSLQILTQQNADQMEKEFNRLPIDSAVDHFGQLIGVDKFVNVMPGPVTVNK